MADAAPSEGVPPGVPPGVQPGMVICAVNGTAVDSKAAIIACLGGIELGASATFAMRPQGEGEGEGAAPQEFVLAKTPQGFGLNIADDGAVLYGSPTPGSSCSLRRSPPSVGRRLPGSPVSATCTTNAASGCAPSSCPLALSKFV